jgi:DNA mismatch endonuclease, patch repair protein
MPRTRTAFWKQKFLANMTRDKKHALALRQLGWRFVVVWECELRDEAALTKKLQVFLKYK